jgi:hypothetical protein
MDVRSKAAGIILTVSNGKNPEGRPPGWRECLAPPVNVRQAAQGKV